MERHEITITAGGEIEQQMKRTDSGEVRIVDETVVRAGPVRSCECSCGAAFDTRAEAEDHLDLLQYEREELDADERAFRTGDVIHVNDIRIDIVDHDAAHVELDRNDFDDPFRERRDRFRQRVRNTDGATIDRAGDD